MLVGQGYTQEERIDYDEVFAPISIIETIRLFLAYDSFKDLVVYQMDVKSAFLYGKIEKEVYVCQPLGFEDPDFPDRVYKVEKALYGLHQAPKPWYETLSTYLLDNGFQRGKIDKTLFIKRDKGDILLVSSMGELTFFLGLQVKQKEDGIFISQDKYVTEILKKFGFTDVKTASTPMETQKALLKDEDSEEVDVHLYRSMIDSLMYLTSSRPDIMFVVSYTDSDYARSSLDRKSTIGGYQFLGCRLISWQCKKQTMVANSTTEAEYVAASSCCGQVLWIQNQLIDYRDSNEKKLIQMIKIHTDKNVADLLTKAFNLQALVDGKKIIVTEASIRRDLQLDDEEGMDCLPNATIFEELTRMFAKSTAWNDFSSTMASAIIYLATNQKFNFSKYIFESMVKNLDNAGKFLMYPRQGKDFSGRVTPLFPAMVVQAQKEMGEGVLNDEEVFAGQDMAKKEVSTADLVTTASELVTTDNVEVSYASPTAATITNVELTLAQTLAELKSIRPKTKGVVMQEPCESTPTISLKLSSQAKGQGSVDKGKAKMIELEKPLKKKDHIKFDEEEALRLQAAFDEEDRLAREKAQLGEEANIAWDDIQAKIDADYQLAERMVNTFVDMDIELVKGSEIRARGSKTREENSSKRAEDELEQEKAKKKKVDDD
ncbi:putative ribonuclease H-like domain-containing protein [Tanacetum coccineum]